MKINWKKIGTELCAYAFCALIGLALAYVAICWVDEGLAAAGIK